MNKILLRKNKSEQNIVPKARISPDNGKAISEEPSQVNREIIVSEELQDNPDVRAKISDPDVSKIFRFNKDWTDEETKQKLANAREIIKLLTNDSPEKEVTLNKNSSNLTLNKDNPALESELSRIRTNYRTLWQDNLNLQEENNFLQAKLESVTTEKLTAMNTNSNAVTTRSNRKNKSVCIVCPKDHHNSDDD